MSVKLRLAITGKTHQRSFRVVAQDTQSKRDGKFLEILGSLDSKKNLLKIKKERVSYWLSKGAKPTATVAKILQK
jgi:small subunit ribosomal protein S16